MNIISKTLIIMKVQRTYEYMNCFRDTYVERQPGESANDRNDRAIRVAVNWYDKHLDGTNVRAVLITDDAKNRQLAIDDGILASSSIEIYPIKKSF